MTEETQRKDETTQPFTPTRRAVLGLAGAAGAAAFSPMWPPAPASAVTINATINVDTSTDIPIQAGVMGYNIHITNRAYHFTDTAYRAMIAQLQPRWGRWSAGTANNVFHPKTGTMPEERRGQMYDKRNQFYLYDWERRVLAGKNGGYMDLITYYDSLRETCAAITMVVNTFTGTPAEAADLARFCSDNHIVVDFWELQNEPYLFTGGGTSVPKYYNSATDYLNKVKPFHDAIRGADPNAKTVIAYTPTGANLWDDRIFDVTSPWWNAISWHTYELDDPNPGNGLSFLEARQHGNWLVAELRDRIDTNYLARSRLSPTPILQNELDVRVAGPLYNSQYNAIFNAEAVMRLTTAAKDNTRMLTGAGGIPLWVLDAANDHTNLALDALEAGTTVNTDSLNHNLYFKTVGVANVIINEAINNTASRWNTTITGSGTVTGLDGNASPVTVPALFATSYRGALGGNMKSYVLVTNKSADEHIINLRLDGTTLSSPVTAVYSTATDPQAGNTNSNPSTVTAQTTNYANGSAITIPPFSVVRIQWNSTGTPAAPRTPRITNATVQSGSSVRLKWWNVPNATSYTIRYGTASGVYTSTHTATASDDTTVTGLNPGTTYYFVVSATGTGGTTPNSNEIAVSCQAPAAPSNVAADGRRGGVTTVTWRSVARANSYTVRYGTSPSALTSSVNAGNRMGIDIGGLASGTTYYFTVEAVNGAGTSPASAVASGVAVLAMPYTPVRLRLTGPNTSTSASLAWQPSLVRTFTDYFEDGNATGWSIAGGTWSVTAHPAAGRNTQVFATTGSGLAEATAGDNAWTDVSVDVQVDVASFAGNGTVSLLGRYTSASNFYRFVYQNSGQVFKLIRTVNGTHTTLAQVALADAGQPFSQPDPNSMRLIFEAVGSTITCCVNHLPIITVTDTAHPSGRIALGANNQIAYFDKVHVWTDNMTGAGGTYTLYRSNNPQSGYNAIASGLTSPQYTDNTLTAGNTYYYKVSAVKGGTESLGNSVILTVVT